MVLSGYNNLGGKPPLAGGSPGRVSEVTLSSGGGFYVYHEANNSFAEWSDYNNMIGLGWRAANQGDAIIVKLG